MKLWPSGRPGLHKISRIYVANAGIKLAWYDGLLLQFTDTESDEPTHTIYNLVNQGGKTTFLSLVFSTFDTPKDRFLQHLTNRGQRFEDYFDRDGLPGFIVVEWHLPGDMFNTKSLVTGQIVVMKKAGDTFEPDRIFFWFHGSDELSLESIPGPKLKGGQELRSRDQVMRWLHEMRIKHPGHFEYTTSQTDWRQALESEGLDVEMLRHQVDFNRKEGSMDEAFLDFKTEYDFTRRFLSLAMDTRAADGVRELVASHCRRMTRRKPLEDSRLQLEKLSDTFAGFASASRDYLAADVQRQTTEMDVAVACSTLDGRARERLAAADEQTQFAEAQERAEGVFRQQKVSQLKETEAYRQELLRRTEAAAKAKFETTKDEVSSAERKISLYQAAELLAEHELREGEVNQLNQAIEAAHADIRPFREDLSHKAALLRLALGDNHKDRAGQAEAAKFAAQVASEQLKLLGENERQLHQDQTSSEREGAQLEQRIGDAERRRALLVKEGILAEEELPEAALGRLGTAAIDLERKEEESETRAKSHEDQIEVIQAALLTISTEKAQRTTEAEQLDLEINEAQSWHDRLKHDPVLTRAIGAEVVDPDSEALSPSLTRFLLRTQDELSEAELVLARLEEDDESIRDTGLAGNDPDISRIVRHLSDAGVANAAPHAEYLAEVLPQAEAARAVVMSNPGRFLGVAVANTTQLELAREALKTAPSINKPVVISIASDQVFAASADHIVAPPGDDSFYNYSAAQARATKLAEKISQAQHARDELRNYLKLAHDAEAHLKHYQTKYGHGRRSQMRQELNQVRSKVQGLETELGTSKQNLDLERTGAKTEREEAKRCASRLANLQGQIQHLQTFITEYTVNLAKWKARLAEVKLLIEQSIVDLEGLSTRKNGLEEERNKQLESEIRLRSDATALADECAALPPNEILISAEDELAAKSRPLDVLRSEYRTAETILRRVEEDKTGHLVIQRDAVKSTASAVQEKFLDAAIGLDIEEIRAHMTGDYRNAVQLIKAQKSEAENRHTRAAESRAIALQNLTDFQRKRTYPDYSIPGIDSQPDGGLAFRLSDAEQQARRLAESESDAQTQARDALAKAKDLKQESETYANQAATLKGLLAADAVLPPADPVQFSSTTGIGEICEKLARALKEAGSRLERAHKAAHHAHEKVQLIVGDESFIKVDAELSVTLKSNPLDATIQDYARIEAAITDRMAAVVGELSTMNQDFERATEQLVGLVNTAIRLLHRAAEDMKLPDNVPVVGGQTVVKMSRTLFTLTHEGRRAGLKPYMETLAADGNIPESGAALATQALLRLANDRLGIRILKMVEITDEQYVPVDRLSHSGAERISMALLLYFIIAKLRYEQRAQQRKAQGGVLILDNPFAKATARPIWQAILSLADSMGVQLIIATGMKEYDTLSVFRRFLRLAKSERNMTTGRTHVSVADFNFRPELVKETA